MDSTCEGRRGLMKKQLRMATIVIIVLVATFSLQSGNKKEEVKPLSETKKKVALILKMQQGDYGDIIKMGAEAAAKEFNVALSVSAPVDEGNITSQVDLINKSIREGTDAIVLAANDYKAVADAVNRAVSQGIAVIAIDSEIDSSKVRSFIGINNYEAGRKAGKKLAELTGEQGRIAVMSFVKSAPNAEQREQGLLEELRKYPKLQIVDQAYCNSDLKLCGELTEKVIKERGPVDGIVALNDVSSLGVSNNLVNMGLDGKVKLVAFDSTSEELGLLQDGVIHATIIQNPFSMGYLGVKYALEATLGRTIPERVDTETKVIDLENMFWSDNQKLLFPFVK
jgi:ribose transport system substrate-binding protein